jgi:hypothetical protein
MASTPGHKRGFGANRPVPALLMKRPAAVAVPEAPAVPMSAANDAPDVEPAQDPQAESLKA